LKEGVSISKLSAELRSARRVVIVAGEASGDVHGANLVKAMRQRDPSIRFAGVGGARMEEAGVHILIPAGEMAVVGMSEVLPRLRTIAKAHRILKSLLRDDRPDLLILIDYPGFNLHLAKIARASKVPVLYYISPQVWAWRTGRVRKIAKRVNQMAVILPFEEPFYSARGVTVKYVGHPLMDHLPSNGEAAQLKSRLDRDGAKPVLGILPGSRREEVRNLLPIMVRAADILKGKCPRMQCLLPLAPTLTAEFVESCLGSPSVPVQLIEANACTVLEACDAALVTSGTATLETAIMGVPMVIVYRVSPFSYWMGKRLVKVPHIGLVNLVAGEQVVSELIQGDATPEKLAREVMTILEDAEIRAAMIGNLRAVTEKLGKGGAAERTASLALEMMNR
jgi:lipid-A-disaccharide synthase